MGENENDFVTQEETGEIPPSEQVEGRVEAEMKRIEGSARESVGQGIQDEEVERAGRELKEQAERELQEQREKQQ
jgi:uncharacterized protein YjbJ (UPF0337 family)